ncbi:hypothetical protein M3148_02005 [Georgenia satyanarayanai]|uniref:hypothetical protein n=1 Tax=Georgenia satyanarayanai TaxID=860221 RepID=UPI002040A4D9|nr:hypothetical protein [Georgenia satyanarayanai]MCM3659773.1 hypothetical protein [Georgenia satyanarayanai]
MSITYRDLTARLTEQEIEHHTIALHDGSLIVVSHYGGRVYGPFRGPDRGSETWVPEAFASPEAFDELVRSGFWNVGGERIWIGPEVTYIIEDRDDYWGTFVLPTAIDPAPHTCESRDPLILQRAGTVTARNTGSGDVTFELGMRVRPAPSPLRFVGTPEDPLRALRCAGYSVTITLDRGETSAPMESWDIVQVLAGGTALIPAVGVAEVTDYYEPVGDLLTRRPGVLATSLTGRDRFKIGVKAPHVFGRSGYVRRLAGDEYALLVRDFGNRAEAPYGEEPDFAPGVMGDSIHLYNDDGGLGGFAEVESRGTPTGTDTDRTTSTDTFTSWWFFGTRDEIDRASAHLLGAGVGELENQ